MQSYAIGPTLPLMEKTIGQVLAESAARHPAGMAVISRHQGLRVSYAELQERAERAARGLWGLGLRPGDRVGIWSSNCVEWVELQLATALTGVVLVNVNPAYRSHELRYVLRKSGMKAIFLQEKDVRCNYLEILNEAREGQEMALRHIVVLAADSWAQMLRDGASYPGQTLYPEDVANIQYSSGTP